MAKKLIAIVMALALVLSFAACGGKGSKKALKIKGLFQII